MVQEAGRARAGLKSFAPTEARIPNLSACSESLYLLCYSAPLLPPQWRIICRLLLQRRAVKMRNKLRWLRAGSKGRPLWTLWCTMRSIKQRIPGLAEQGRVQHCLKYFSSLSLRVRTKWQAAKQAMYTGRTVPTTGVWIFSWQINNDYTCHLQLGDLLELRERRERLRTQCVNISCIFLYIYLYSQLYNITCNKLKPKGRHIFDPSPQTYEIMKKEVTHNIICTIKSARMYNKSKEKILKNKMVLLGFFFRWE